MNNEILMTAVISALGKLSDDELKHFSALLRQPEANLAITKMLESTLILRKLDGSTEPSEEHHHTKPGRQAKITSAAALVRSAEEYEHTSSEILKTAFFQELSNKRKFPTIRDLVRVLNKLFELDFDYESVHRGGRERLVKRAWVNIETFPRATQYRMLTVFFEQFASRSDRQDEYNRLFRILVNK